MLCEGFREDGDGAWNRACRMSVSRRQAALRDIRRAQSMQEVQFSSISAITPRDRGGSSGIASG